MIRLATPSPSLDFSFVLRRAARGKVGTVAAEFWEAGGKAVNLARFLRALGRPFALYLGTGGGTDPTHVFYRALLAADGLPTRLEPGPPLRVNIVLSGAARGKFNHPGFSKAARGLSRFATRVESAVHRGDHVVLTGRLPAGVSAAWYARLLSRLHRRGAWTALDASGAALGFGLSARPSFLKVNRFELEDALRVRFRNLESLARSFPRLARRLPAEGAVTDGAAGALAWSAGRLWRVRMRKLPRGPRPVVGAGDGFLAGWLDGLLRSLGAGERLRRAAAAGWTVARFGIHGFTAARWKSAWGVAAVREGGR